MAATLPSLVDQWCDPALTDTDSTMTAILSIVPSAVSVSDLLRSVMGPYLTHADGKVRGRACGLLAALLQRCGPALLSSPTSTGSGAGRGPEAAVAAPLLDFFLGRMEDYPSLAAAADGVQQLLGPLAASLPDGSAVRFTAALFGQLNVPSLDHSARYRVLCALRAVCRSERWLAEAAADSRAFATGVTLCVEGEKDPRCLVVTLEVVQRTLMRCAAALQAGGDQDVLDELFDVAACYFPIAFTPPPKDPHGITRAQLAGALLDVFTCTHRVAPAAMSVLFEKLSSSVVAAKVDALDTLAACTRAYGASTMLPFVREACDAVRNEAVHGSDAEVVPHALSAVTQLTQTVTAAADPAGPPPPGWADINACLVRVSVTDVVTAPDSLLGRGGVTVLASVAAASGFAFAHVLSALQPLLPIVFDPTRKAEARAGAVTALRAVTGRVPPSAFQYVAVCDVAGTLREVADTMTSVLATPGGLDPPTQANAGRAVVNVWCAFPVGSPPPAPHIVAHLVAGVGGPAVLSTECEECLVTLARHAPGAVLSDAVPPLLAAVQSAVDTDSLPPASTPLRVVASLCVAGGLLDAVLPRLLGLCLQPAAAATDAPALLLTTPSALAVCDVAVSAVASAGPPAVCADCLRTPNGLLPALFRTWAACSPGSADPLAERVETLACRAVQAVCARGDGDSAASVRDAASQLVLRPVDVPPTPLLSAASLSPAAVPARAAARVLGASLASGGRGAPVPAAVPLAAALLDAILDEAAAADTALAAAQALAGVLNRVAKDSACVTAAMDRLWAVAGGSAVSPVRMQAVSAFGLCLSAVMMAGVTGAQSRSWFHSLCDLTAASAPPPVSLAAGGAIAAAAAPACDTLLKSFGAVVTAVYQQRLFAWLCEELVEGVLPGSLSPGALRAVCGAAAAVSVQVLRAGADKVASIAMVALACEDEDVAVDAVAVTQVLISEHVSLVTPHLSSAVPRLVRMACTGRRAIVRARALDCLRAFTTLPFHQLNPLRPSVVRGLVPALDDPKRGVRRRAAACRNDWITLSTTPC